MASDRFRLSIRNIADWEVQTPEEVERIKEEGAKLMKETRRTDPSGVPDEQQTYHIVTLFEHHADKVGLSGARRRRPGART